MPQASGETQGLSKLGLLLLLHLGGQYWVSTTVLGAILGSVLRNTLALLKGIYSV